MELPASCADARADARDTRGVSVSFGARFVYTPATFIRPLKMPQASTTKPPHADAVGGRPAPETLATDNDDVVHATPRVEWPARVTRSRAHAPRRPPTPATRLFIAPTPPGGPSTKHAPAKRARVSHDTWLLSDLRGLEAALEMYNHGAFCAMVTRTANGTVHAVVNPMTN
jgi:hypothetical protein